MSPRLPGFRGEYLWEFEIAEQQLLALAETFPAQQYGWRAADTARSVSEILVHLAAGSRIYLVLVGADAAPELYDKLEGESMARIMAMIAINERLEKSITDKTAVVAFLVKSLQAVRSRFMQASDEELDRPEVFVGEHTTVRRFYMRALCHLHEHMGQLIAYARAMGIPAPWQAARDAQRKAIENELASRQ